MELGKRITKIRKDNKLTQDDFAKKYYVTRQTISNWENEKSYPDLETLVKISDDFNVSLDTLLKEDDRMIKDISKKQKNYKFIKVFVVILNIIGLSCLIYFAIPFLQHDMTIKNPNAMLAGYTWDSCGFILCLGLIPLIVANIMAYIFLDVKIKLLKLLYFIPSLICLILVSGYWFISFYNEEPKYKSELVTGMKCELNKKVYKYDIYKEPDGTYSVSMDEKDRIPQSVIDYETPDEIFKSIEKYYIDNGGMCP